MVGLKRAITGGIALTIGIVTLRRLRERRRDPREEAEVAAKESLNEAAKAAEHATEALIRARVAGEKAIEVASDEIGAVSETVTPEQKSSRVKRIRNKAKKVVRR